MNVLDAWLDAWNKHDGGKLAALMADGGTYEVMATGRKYTAATIADAVAARDGLLSSNYTIKYVSTIQDGDRYATEWEMTGTNDRALTPVGQPASDRSFTIYGSSHGVSEGGRIKAHRDYWDINSLLAQLAVEQNPAVDFTLAYWSEEPSPDE